MDENNVIIVPREDRILVVAAEERDIIIPAESRVIEVTDMLITSKAHTAGNTIRWKVDYDQWLDNAAEIQTMNIVSSSTTLTAGQIQILGRHIYFFLIGGNVNEQATISLA